MAHIVGPGSIASYSGLLAEKTYIPGHITLTSISALWFILISLTLGTFTASVWPNANAISSSAESAWVTAFATIPRKDADRQSSEFPYIKLEIKVKDGSSYQGFLGDYSKNIEAASREIILEPPLVAISKDRRPVQLGNRWHRMILPASEISGILVSYEKRTQEAANPVADEKDANKNKIAAHLVFFLHRFLNWLHAKRNRDSWLGKVLLTELMALFAYALICGRLI